MNTRVNRSLIFALTTALTLVQAACAQTGTPTAAQPGGKSGAHTGPDPEVRGTWVTTTGNSALASPADTAVTMRRLREIGLNTVYVETWKNGYTQYPSQTLQRTIGVDRRPALVPQDPSDKPEAIKSPGRDLLQESLIEAHRNGLIYIGWFEYGFMAAHKTTDNHLRRMKKEWLSLDAKGNEVASNGFVWMNPLHPEARRFLLDLVLEAVDKYEMDGIQLDDRIVWPYIDMGYDDYTRKVYASEHNGKQPPADPKDKEWMRWRADKVNEFSKQFVQEIRARRPGLLVSLSPAVYPWCWEYYLLEWPKWSAWTGSDKLTVKDNPAASAVTPRWDEFIPQVYRMNYKAYEQTWLEQVKYMKEEGGGRVRDLVAGIRVVGDGPDATWDDVRKSIELTRSTKSGGYVLWYSRGALDLYPKELASFNDVANKGIAANPQFGAGWRTPSIALKKNGASWSAGGVGAGAYRLIVHDGASWQYANDIVTKDASTKVQVELPETVKQAELLIDRRAELARPRQPR